MNINFAIWSTEHRAYWRQDRHGYTSNPNDAGLFRTDEALEICINAAYDDDISAPPDMMLPEEALKTIRQTWDFQTGDPDPICEAHRIVDCDVCNEPTCEHGFLNGCPRCDEPDFDQCSRCGDAGCSSCNGVSIP